MEVKFGQFWKRDGKLFFVCRIAKMETTGEIYAILFPQYDKEFAILEHINDVPKKYKLDSEGI